jgi:hypothetical protein
MRPKFLLIVALSLSLYFSLSALASGATAEAFAFQAPDCTTINTYCANFLQYELPNLTGIGITVPWTMVDTGTTAPNYVFSGWLDGQLNAYINPNSNDPSFNWTTGCFGGVACKIMLIIQPESDATGLTAWNPYTPPYVFLSTYATSVGADSPQDVAACSSMPGKGTTGSPLPYTGTMGSTDYVVWNTNSCKVVAGSHLTCTCTGSSCGITNFTAFPVVYEKPIVTAYQNFLKALSANYSTGGPDYSIGKYISYVRAGMALGGENLPLCADTNSLTLPNWQAGAAVSAGYVITPTTNNAGGYTFVAIHGGTAGSSAPAWNQTPGNRTTNDGTAVWENDGTRASGGTAIWPGANGQFGTSPQPQGYTDNGYLRAWPSTGATGYIAEMVKFLGSLSSSFNWDFSSHYGPYMDISYADSEAVMANALGNGSVGFGMQSLNVEDPVAYALGTFPTSREDWAANFTNYPAVPVHHLQTNSPGNKYYTAGYAIQQITGNGTLATTTCSTDCSWFAGEEIYITGTTSFNGTWLVSCTSCLTDELTFSTTISGTNSSGTVWAPDYWPRTLNFAVNTVPHGATAIELWECDLDYAFGVQTTYDSPNNTSATGCATWGLGGSSSIYQSALSTIQ